MSIIGVRLNAKTGGRGRCVKLVMYIHDPIGNPDPDKIAKTGGERVLFRGSNGVMSETPIGIANEMRQTADIAQAQDNRVSDDPFEHFIFSFESHDVVGEKEIRKCIQIAVKHLGVEMYQYTWGAHKDTDNTHIHLAVSRIHPISFKALDIKFPVIQAEQIGARINHALGMKPMVKNRFVVNEQTQEVERLTSKAVPKPERLSAIINTSQSWHEFHARTFKAGILYEKKGSGAMINGDKASNVDRNATMIKLTKMWGEFEKSPHIPVIKPTLEVIERKVRHERKTDRKNVRSSQAQSHQEERSRIVHEAKEMKRAILANKAISREDRLVSSSLIAMKKTKALAEVRDQQKMARLALTRYLNETLPLIDFHKRESAFHGPIHSLTTEDIRGFTPHRRGGEVEYTLKGSEIVSFVDKGRIIVVFDKNDESLLAVLQLGAAKWGCDMVVTGGDEFKAQAVRLAVAHGIALSNPELQELIQQEAERLARERKDLGAKIFNVGRIKEIGASSVRLESDDMKFFEPPIDEKMPNVVDENDGGHNQCEIVPTRPRL